MDRPDRSREPPRPAALKLSAGLALAAADPSLAGSSRLTPTPAVAGSATSLSGIWHSRYEYFSSGLGQHLDGEHYVVLRQESNRLVGESVPSLNESVVKLDLVLEGSVATGSWTEQTSPTGYYRGAVYHGAIQLVVDPLGKNMAGRWVGCNRKFAVNSDVWELAWVSDANSSRAIRDYHLKA